MRKIIVSIHSTLDGVVTGPPDDKDNFVAWAEAGIKDTASSEALLETFATVDTILLGHRTYEGLAAQWPNVEEWPNPDEITLRLGDKVNKTPKLVVAKEKISNLKWGKFEPPKQLTGSNVEARIKAMKDEEGRDILTFGSRVLVQSLINANLVDELQIFVHPVIVGEGGRLFDHILGRKDLRLVSTQTFDSGAMLVRYERAAA
jgi:dihydrofolate reductase